MIGVADQFGIELVDGGPQRAQEGRLQPRLRQVLSARHPGRAAAPQGRDGGQPRSFIAFSYPPDTLALTEQPRRCSTSTRRSSSSASARPSRSTSSASARMPTASWASAAGTRIRRRSRTISSAIRKRRPRARPLGEPDHLCQPAGPAAGDREGRQDRPRRGRSRNCRPEPSTPIIGKVKLEGGLLKEVWGVGQWQNGEFYGVAPVTKEAPARSSSQARLEASNRCPPRSSMLIVDIILGGLILGGMYALVAMGLTLQYGVARIMNLAYGEFLIAAAFAAYWLFTTPGAQPARRARPGRCRPASRPAGSIYRGAVDAARPRARRRGMPSRSTSILATFGLLFVIQGVAFVLFGGQYYSYSLPRRPVHHRSASTIAAEPADRLRLRGRARRSSSYLAHDATRTGTAIRAVAVDPAARKPRRHRRAQGRRPSPSRSAARSAPQAACWSACS